MKTQSIELFRMVHLRGADNDKAIDPSTDPGVTVKILKSTSFNELNSKEGPRIVKEATADREPIKDETMETDYPWNQALDAIRAKDNKALKAISLD